MNRSLLIGFALAFAIAVPGGMVQSANAEEATVIRFATLAPHGSAFMKIMRAWDASLRKGTDNKVMLRYYSGGSQGDERDFMRKVRAGQMDAAGVSTTGLGIVVRPVLVLTAPGLIRDYDQLNRVRQSLDSKFEKMFEDAGFKLIAWGDAGKNLLFSTTEFSKPSDFKSRRPWAWKDDPVFTEFVKMTGANPVRLPLGEVYPGLQTKMVDTVPASALGAVALQWYTKLGYMTKQNINMIVGASVMKKEKFDALTKQQQDVLVDTGKRAALALNKLVMRDDETSRQTLLKRGLKEIDLSPHQAEWDEVAKKTREGLAGRVYSKELLKAVEDAAK
ncbi:MAG: TRAP transporter substrate-binding protein DctP [Polyangiales bacterium]